MNVGLSVGDIGGFRAAKPVAEIAIASGHRVFLHLAATCARQYQEGKLPPIEGLDEGMVVTSLPDSSMKVDVCLIGASQSEEGTKAAVDVICAVDAPTCIIEDYFGSAVPLLNTLLPNSYLTGGRLQICVSDVTAKNNVLTYVRSNLARVGGPGSSSYIHVTGMPQYHDLISRLKPRWPEIRQDIRQHLGIADDQLITLIAGQLNGTAEAITATGLAFEAIGKFVYGLVRQHPGATPIDKQLTRWMLEGCDNDLGRGYTFISDENLKEELPAKYTSQTEMLLPVADIVVSNYSTSLRYAAICGITGTISLGTPSLAHDLMAEKGLKVSPEVSAGAVWHAKDEKELATVISQVLAEEPSEAVNRIKEAQSALAALNDDQAARRILDVAINMAK